jgi:RHS repeat-associated protein
MRTTPLSHRAHTLRSKNDADVTIQTAEFDALGRRIKKVVSHAGEYDKTVVYLYDGQKIIEIRNGSNAMVQQFIHGTQYIDELVMIRVKDKGDLYVHQDANWNVVGLTDLGGHLVERYVYSPYGELIVHQSTGYGDRDGDGDVDSTDKGTVGTTCTGTVSGSCRILDLDFDGDYDSTDATKFDSLAQGLQRNPGRLATAVSQPFAHQGLLFEPEIGSYQNRARQYDPGKRRFVQRDPLAFLQSHFLPHRHYLDGLSLFSYQAQNPTGFLDPQGTDCRTEYDDCMDDAHFDRNLCLSNVSFICGMFNYCRQTIARRLCYSVLEAGCNTANEIDEDNCADEYCLCTGCVPP